MHETPLRERGDGRATGQPQGLGPEAYLFSTSQGSRPEDARKDGQIRGRSRWFVHNAGWGACRLLDKGGSRHADHSDNRAYAGARRAGGCGAGRRAGDGYAGAVSPWTPSLRTPENTGGTLAKYARLVRSQLVPPARHPLPINDHAITHHRPKRHRGQVGAAISAVLFVRFGVGCGGSLFSGRCIVATERALRPPCNNACPGLLERRELFVKSRDLNPLPRILDRPT